MSDGAPDPAGAEAAARDERQQQVLRLGAAGLGRAEIAEALGMCPEALAQRAAEDAALAAALRGAAGLAEAWWDRVAREAFEAGRFNFVTACAREMRRRFGESGPAEPGPAKPKAGRDLRGERPRARYLLPCNGMTKLNPDGTCPCGAYHDDDYWRAEHEAWRAESPENAETPSWDELQNQGDDENDADDESDADEEVQDGEQL